VEIKISTFYLSSFTSYACEMQRCKMRN